MEFCDVIAPDLEDVISENSRAFHLAPWPLRMTSVAWLGTVLQLNQFIQMIREILISLLS